ncbi:MAG: heme ABC exporter ATP-binding protein CcmA [Pseudomonadota bacterium]
MSLFEGKDLTCIRAERWVFQGLDFTLAAGEALVVIGPNGSGKSSLLRLMAGLIRPAAGQLTWCGQALEEAAHRSRLHYLGHLDAVKPVLTAREVLNGWASLRGASAERVPEALDRFGLTELAELPCRLLSAGQRRRLALARLLATPAELWLLDEPSVGLDKESQGRLAAVIAQHQAGGGRVALATHEALDLEDPRQLDMGALTPPAAPELVW